MSDIKLFAGNTVTSEVFNKAAVVCHAYRESLRKTDYIEYDGILLYDAEKYIYEVYEDAEFGGNMYCYIHLHKQGTYYNYDRDKTVEIMIPMQVWSSGNKEEYISYFVGVMRGERFE